jgi:trypsin
VVFINEEPPAGARSRCRILQAHRPPPRKSLVERLISGRVALAAVLSLVGLTNCGRPATSDVQIIGGTTTSQPYPFFVSLTSGGAAGRFCGASLIARRIVLTAAHCVDGQQGTLFVHFESQRSESEGVDITARKVVAHQSYDPMLLVNDIALIQLAEDAPDYAHPVELSERSADTAVGGDLRVIGFGNLSSVGWVEPSHLMQVDIQVLPASDCQQPYESFDGTTQVCAGSPGGGLDSCQGDSGGPLFRGTSSGGARSFQIEGLVSYGNGCAQKGSPGVYTRVSAFRNWIDLTIADFQMPAHGAETLVLNRIFRQECYSTLSVDTEENRNGGVIREYHQLTIGGSFKPLGGRSFRGTIASTPECHVLLDDGQRVDFFLGESTRNSRRGRYSVLAFVGGEEKPTFIAPLSSRSDFSLVCQNGDLDVFWNVLRPYSQATLEMGHSTFFSNLESSGNGFRSEELLASCQVGSTRLILEKGVSKRNEETYLVTVTNLLSKRSGVDHRFEYTLLPSDGAQVDARLATRPSGELELVLTNLGQEAMYGWRLTCDAPLALQLSNGALLESRAVGAGEFELSLFDPLVPERAILAGQSIRPVLINIEQVRAWAKKQNEQYARCDWNSFIVEIDLGLTLPPAPAPVN